MLPTYKPNPYNTAATAPITKPIGSDTTPKPINYDPITYPTFKPNPYNSPYTVPSLTPPIGQGSTPTPTPKDIENVIAAGSIRDYVFQGQPPDSLSARLTQFTLQSHAETLGDSNLAYFLITQIDGEPLTAEIIDNIVNEIDEERINNNYIFKKTIFEGIENGFRSYVKMLLEALSNTAAPYYRFILTDLQTSQEEKLQVIPTFGDEYGVLFTGRNPVTLGIAGKLVLDYGNRLTTTTETDTTITNTSSYEMSWYHAMRLAYEFFMRGSRLARWRLRVNLCIPEIGWFSGYAINYTETMGAEDDSDTVIPFNMGLLLIKPGVLFPVEWRDIETNIAPETAAASGEMTAEEAADLQAEIDDVMPTEFTADDPSVTTGEGVNPLNEEAARYTSLSRDPGTIVPIAPRPNVTPSADLTDAVYKEKQARCTLVAVKNNLFRAKVSGDTQKVQELTAVASQKERAYLDASGNLDRIAKKEDFTLQGPSGNTPTPALVNIHTPPSPRPGRADVIQRKITLDDKLSLPNYIGDKVNDQFTTQYYFGDLPQFGEFGVKPRKVNINIKFKFKRGQDEFGDLPLQPYTVNSTTRQYLSITDVTNTLYNLDARPWLREIGVVGINTSELKLEALSGTLGLFKVKYALSNILTKKTAMFEYEFSLNIFDVTTVERTVSFDAGWVIARG